MPQKELRHDSVLFRMSSLVFKVQAIQTYSMLFLGKFKKRYSLGAPGDQSFYQLKLWAMNNDD